MASNTKNKKSGTINNPTGVYGSSKSKPKTTTTTLPVSAKIYTGYQSPKKSTSTTSKGSGSSTSSSPTSADTGKAMGTYRAPQPTKSTTINNPTAVYGSSKPKTATLPASAKIYTGYQSPSKSKSTTEKWEPSMEDKLKVKRELDRITAFANGVYIPPYKQQKSKSSGTINNPSAVYGVAKPKEEGSATASSILMHYGKPIQPTSEDKSKAMGIWGQKSYANFDKLDKEKEQLFGSAMVVDLRDNANSNKLKILQGYIGAPVTGVWDEQTLNKLEAKYTGYDKKGRSYYLSEKDFSYLAGVEAASVDIRDQQYVKDMQAALKLPETGIWDRTTEKGFRDWEEQMNKKDQLVQADPYMSNIPLDGNTISAVGCSTTALSKALKVAGIDKRYGEIYDWINKEGDPRFPGTIPWRVGDFLRSEVPEVKVKGVSANPLAIKSQSASVEQFERNLDQDGQGVLCYGYGFTGAHYVAVEKDKIKNQYLVYDYEKEQDGTYGSKTYSYNNLSEFLDKEGLRTKSNTWLIEAYSISKK